MLIRMLYKCKGMLNKDYMLGKWFCMLEESMGIAWEPMKCMLCLHGNLTLHDHPM